MRACLNFVEREVVGPLADVRTPQLRRFLADEVIQTFPVAVTKVANPISPTITSVRVDADGGVSCPQTPATNGDLVDLGTVSFRPAG